MIFLRASKSLASDTVVLLEVETAKGSVVSTSWQQPAQVLFQTREFELREPQGQRDWCFINELNTCKIAMLVDNSNKKFTYVWPSYVKTTVVHKITFFPSVCQGKQHKQHYIMNNAKHFSIVTYQKNHQPMWWHGQRKSSKTMKWWVLWMSQPWWRWHHISLSLI